jgi:hypothetical protein
VKMDLKPEETLDNGAWLHLEAFVPRPGAGRYVISNRLVWIGKREQPAGK